MTETNQSMTVLKVNGEVFARRPGGNLRLLKPGDVLHEGDLLVTVSGSTVLQDASGQTLELPPNHSVRIGPDQSTIRCSPPRRATRSAPGRSIR